MRQPAQIAGDVSPHRRQAAIDVLELLNHDVIGHGAFLRRPGWPPAGVEEGHGVERLVTEHSQIDVAAGPGFASGPTAVQPRAQQPLPRKRGGTFANQDVGEAFRGDRDDKTDPWSRGHARPQSVSFG